MFIKQAMLIVSLNLFKKRMFHQIVRESFQVKAYAVGVA